MQAWQAKVALVRQPYLRKLHVPAFVPCTCEHDRFSHSVLVLICSCKSCACVSYNPLCECGHKLDYHAWGTGADTWSCAADTGQPWIARDFVPCGCKKFSHISRTFITAPLVLTLGEISE